MARQLKVFVLEDCPDRIRRFAKWFGTGLSMDAPILWDCIHTCQRDYDFQPPYDIMFLDHDLGGRDIDSGDAEDNGVTFCESMKSLIPVGTPIIIHSFNTHGAERMKAILKPITDELECIPYGNGVFMKNINRVRELAGFTPTSY